MPAPKFVTDHLSPLPSSTDKATKLLSMISSRFNWLEKADLRVGSIFLHKDEVEVLRTRQGADFDAISSMQLRILMPEYVGALWGAQVFENPHIPAGHIAIVPADMRAEILGPGCSIPLAQEE